MARFLRDYRLIVGKAGQKGIEIVPPIRVLFDVEKTFKEEPNAAKFSIYNLAKSTRDEIAKLDMRLVFYAGYDEEEQIYLMTAGAITHTQTKYEGADIVLELEVTDGYVEIRDTMVSLGYGAGARASLMLKEIAKQMGLPLVMADDVPDREWKSGFSYYGAARVALAKLTAGTGLEWSVQNQELQIVKKGGVTKRKAYVLAADSGMLGRPEYQRESSKETKNTSGKEKPAQQESCDQQADGWCVRSFLLPMVNPADIVKVESVMVEDFFKVESVKHTGDSVDGDWVSEFKLVDVKQDVKAKQKG